MIHPQSVYCLWINASLDGRNYGVGGGRVLEGLYGTGLAATPCRTVSYVVDYCREKNNLCLYCGKADHDKNTCPKNFFRSVRCPLCNGQHLGKDCPQMSTTTSQTTASSQPLN